MCRSSLFIVFAPCQSGWDGESIGCSLGGRMRQHPSRWYVLFFVLCQILTLHPFVGESTSNGLIYDLRVARKGDSVVPPSNIDPAYFGKLRTVEYVLENGKLLSDKNSDTSGISYEELHTKLETLASQTGGGNITTMHRSDNAICSSVSSGDREMLVFLHVPQTGGDSLSTLLSWMKMESCSEALGATEIHQRPVNANAYNGASQHPVTTDVRLGALMRPVFLDKVSSPECQQHEFCSSHATEIVPPRLDLAYAPSPFALDVHGNADSILEFYLGWDYVVGHMDVSVASLFASVRKLVHVVTMVRDPIRQILALHQHAVHMSNVVLHPWKLCMDIYMRGELETFLYTEERARQRASLSGADASPNFSEQHSTLTCTLEIARLVREASTHEGGVERLWKHFEAGSLLSDFASAKKTLILGALPSLRGPSKATLDVLLRKFPSYTTYLVGMFSGTLPSSLYGPATVSREQRVQLAHQGLKACAFVGITEEYQMSMRLLRAKFGLKDERIDHGWRFNMKRDTGGNEKVEAFLTKLKQDERAFRELEDALKDDIEVYEHAYDLFDRHVVALGLPEVTQLP